MVGLGASGNALLFCEAGMTGSSLKPCSISCASLYGVKVTSSFVCCSWCPHSLAPGHPKACMLPTLLVFTGDAATSCSRSWAYMTQHYLFYSRPEFIPSHTQKGDRLSEPAQQCLGRTLSPASTEALIFSEVKAVFPQSREGMAQIRMF